MRNTPVVLHHGYIFFTVIEGGKLPAGEIVHSRSH